MSSTVVHAGPGEEEEDDVEDEGEESDGSGKTGDTGAAVCHGHFADVREQSKDSRNARKQKGDNVEYEGVSDPLDKHLGNLDGKFIAQQTVHVWDGKLRPTGG